MKNMITGFLLLSINILSAQQPNSDFILLHRAFANHQPNTLVDKYQESKQNPNELQAILSGLFLTYKALISSQDQNRCTFSPSCSEYGLGAVKKLGIIRGGISTLDRMTRCNGLNARNYPLDAKAMKFIDPVTW